MSKLLGYVSYKDTEALKRLLEENSIETEYYNFNEFWREAEQKQDEGGNGEVEIIASGVDYVLVDMEEYIDKKKLEIEE